MFFEVIPTEVYRNGGGALTYSADLPLLPGQIVLIPLGRKKVLGIVLRRVPAVDFPTKPIERLICPLPLPAHLLQTISWLSNYYLTPVPAVANMLIPPAITSRNALQSLSEAPETILPLDRGQTAIPLNLAQKTVLTRLSEAPGATRLLRGVTGSGKTNIYLKLASEALSRHQSTILLVPEIALTSQLVQIFQSTFGDRIVLIHSQQTIVERRNTWLKILKTTYSTPSNQSTPEPLIIIGPRSALLAPVHNLGLTIIDEAHESAYYQENTPRYSALRLASFIAQNTKTTCLLGTATPNITDYYLAKTHKSLVELSQKAKTSAIEPHITIVDLKNRDLFTKNRYFSTPLLTAIENNAKAGHQTLIFHNRRGSAPLTLCEECGWQALCPECYLPMTLHADTYELSCHICGHTEKVPSSCPNCHHPGIIHKGFGTKLLESELTRLFPELKIARFDGDNTKHNDLASSYDLVKSGQVDILIGTQTLARGLDLPHLATVGIIQADAGLALPDFAAEERAFELLTQVIGRVGRGHLDVADVYIQTYQPDHPVIQTAMTADFPAFAQYLLKKRRSGQLPPFTYLARLSVTYKTEKTTLAKIKQTYATLQTNPQLIVSPPMPSFHERGSRGYTWQLILKSTSRNHLRQALLPFTSNSQYSIVLDPPSLL